jgi:hypothetical protein
VSKDNVIKLIQPGCSTINSPKSCAMEPVRCSPRQSKPRAKRALQEIWMAETKAAAELAFDAFIESYSLKYDKAADCLERIETTFRILRLPGRALETTADDQPDRKHLRYRAPPHHPIEGCLSNGTALAMVFKLVEGAQKSWRRLDGHNQLPKLVLWCDIQRRDRGHRQADRPSAHNRRRLTGRGRHQNLAIARL